MKCPACSTTAQCTRNEVPVLIDIFGRPGYRSGDAYECPECGLQFVAGLGAELDGERLRKDPT